jgi:hypothetical protein
VCTSWWERDGKKLEVESWQMVCIKRRYHITFWHLLTTVLLQCRHIIVSHKLQFTMICKRFWANKSKVLIYFLHSKPILDALHLGWQNCATMWERSNSNGMVCTWLISTTRNDGVRKLCAWTLLSSVKAANDGTNDNFGSAKCKSNSSVYIKHHCLEWLSKIKAFKINSSNISFIHGFWVLPCKCKCRICSKSHWIL